MSPSKAKPETRQAILDAARRLFLRHGYTGTSIEQICSEAGITKGALFHYFESKHALGQKVLGCWADNGQRAFSTGAYLTETDPLKQALGFVDRAIELSQAGPPGCLIGIFSQELAPTDPTMQAICTQSFTGMTEAFERLIVQAKTRHAPDALFDPKSMAQHMFAVFQGAMVLARAYQRPQLVAEHLMHFRAYLEAQFQPRSSGKRRPS